MGIRFRKYIKLAPGVRVNLSGSGASLNFGPRGASVGIGKRGTYLNAGIPGSGLFTRTRLSQNPAHAVPANHPTDQTVKITVSITDEGIITFKDSQGNPVPEEQIEAAKKQQGDKIKGMIREKCDELNEQVEALGRIHEYTSRPDPHRFDPPSFDVSAPLRPTPKSPGFFQKLFKSSVAKIEADNQKAKARYNEELTDWNRKQAEFERQVDADREYVNQVNAGDAVAVERYFESVLQDIGWPRETLVSFDIGPDRIVMIDVDLPEIGEIPTKTASMPQRGFHLSVKEMSATKVQKLYMSHVHALGFRIAGEAFAVSPAIEGVTVSAYSQRASKTTGHVTDEYLYSVKIRRSDWLKINFKNLAHLDIVDSLSQFELRRNMTKTGVFKSIEPFDTGAA